MHIFIPNNTGYLQDIEFNRFNVEPVTYTYTYPDGSTNHGIVYVIEMNTLEDLIEFDRLNRIKNPYRYQGVIVNYEEHYIYLNSARHTLDNRELVEKCAFSLYIYDEYIE